MKPTAPPDEPARLAALGRYRILDTPPEGSFDDLALLAARACSTPMAAVSFLDEQRQWFKARVGFSLTETPRELSFCGHTLAHDEMMLVEDATQDARFAHNPLVTGPPGLRFYAGVPLRAVDGQAIGTLCVLDTRPRELSEEQRGSLLALARQVVAQLELRRQVHEQRRLASERETAVQALAASEARYRTVAEHMPGVVYQFQRSPDGAMRFLFLSDGAKQVLGAEAAAMMMNDVARAFSWLSEEQRRTLQESVRRSAEQLSPWAWEGSFRTDGGDERWFSAASHPSRQADGSIVWDGLLLDVTPRKRAEEALQRSEGYRDLFQHASDAIVIFDPEDEQIIDVNERACQVYGRRRDDLVGHSLREFSPAPAAGAQVLQRLLRDGRHPQFESMQLRADGRPIHFEINASLIEFRGRRVVLSINRDVTARVEAERALAESEQQLRQAQRMEAIGRLAGGIAHDFNNLLMGILGYSDLVLQRLPADSSLRRDVSEIKGAGERAAGLTRQLLTFSRRQPIERRTIDLSAKLIEVSAMLERIIGEDVEMVVHATPGLPSIQGDPAQIEQVLLNLAVNARDAMPSGGTLTVDTSAVTLDARAVRHHPGARPGSYVRLRVSDTGIGMSPAVRARLFEPFFTTKAIGRGTGLGLATVHAIVQQHDGFIDVESVPGQGAVFTLHLPAARRGDGEPVSTPAAAVRGGSETVLLVEDEPTLRSLTRRLLEGLGYTVLLAEDGVQAVEVFRQQAQQIDLVMLDVVMPRLGGREARAYIQALAPTVPVLFMTGYSADPAELMAGHDPVLSKPYDLEQLAHQVRQVLDASSHVRPRS